MTTATLPVRDRTPGEVAPENPSPVTLVPAPPPAPAPERTLAPVPPRPAVAPAEELVALAVAAGSEAHDVAADRVFTAAGGSRERLSAARSLLVERLKLRSDDLEATLALRIVERALARAPHPDGSWRWADNLSPRRMRATDRRRRRVVRRRRTGPRLPARAAWRSAP